MIYQYPNTNFHDLNLDWFLEQFKGLVADWEQFKTDLTADWDDVKGDWITLKTWVENYFNNLDVSAEISAKLDAMLLNGDLDPYLATAAGDWLSANLATPSTPPIDTTLSVASAAADSKTVGDTFKLALMGMGARVTTLNPILADADDADINKVYTIQDTGLVSNLPADADDRGTLFTVSWDDSKSGGNTQIYVDVNNNMYFRIKTGTTPGTWKAWKLASNGCQLTGYGEQTDALHPNLSDANNAEVNRVYGIKATGMVSNLPADAFSDTGCLITVSFSDVQSSTTSQIFIDASSEMFYRLKTGAHPGTWQAWKLASNGCLMRGYGKRADNGTTFLTDADHAQVGCVHTITDAALVSNLPSVSLNRGTLMTYSYSAAEAGGNEQIFTDLSGTMFTRHRQGGGRGVWYAWQPLNLPTALFSMFESAAICGDSYSNGCIDVSGVLTDCPKLSWFNILGRARDVDTELYCKSGATAGAWLTDPDGLAKLQADTTTRQLYVIALGINDGRLSTTLGTIADASASPHPNTFYGNMAEIHDQILIKNPDAKICFITCMRFTAEYTAYTQAIKDLAALYGDLLIDASRMPLFKESQYVLVNGHPVSYLYAEMAYAIEQELTWAILENPSYMQDFNYQ